MAAIGTTSVEVGVHITVGGNRYNIGTGHIDIPLAAHSNGSNVTIRIDDEDAVAAALADMFTVMANQLREGMP